MSFKTFSYSKWSDYAKCPARAKALHIDRIPRDSSPALERGIEFHKQAEEYFLRQERGELLTDWFCAKLDEYRGVEQACVEELWGCTEDFSPSGNGPVWLKIDLCVFLAPDEALVVDHKTGKKEGREIEHAQQGELYAAATLRRFQYLSQVEVQFWYADHDTTSLPRIYTRDDLPRLIRAWSERWDAMANEQIYPAKPGWICRYCPILEKCEDGVEYLNSKWR